MSRSRTGFLMNGRAPDRSRPPCYIRSALFTRRGLGTKPRVLLVVDNRKTLWQGRGSTRLDSTALNTLIYLYLRFFLHVIGPSLAPYQPYNAHSIIPFPMINSPTLLAALAPAPPSPPPGNTPWPRLPRRNLKRPRGLWKARRRLDAAAPSQQDQLSQTTSTTAASPSGRGSDTDREYDSEREMTMMTMMTEESGGEGCSREEDDEDEEEDDSSLNSGSSKRQRRDSLSLGSCGSAELLWAAVYVDPNLTLSPSANLSTISTLTVDATQLDALSRPATGSGPSSGGSGAGGALPAAISEDDDDDDDARARARTTPAAVIANMITTSIAECASCEGEKKETFEYKAWEEIKETLTRASELCDRACSTPSFPPYSVPFETHVRHL